MSNPPASESSAQSRPPHRSPFPPIRTVTLGAPFGWLALGWRDLRGAPAASLFYGAAFALMGLLIHLVVQHMVELTSALTAGFLLLGPFLATGLYDISRRRQRGETSEIGHVVISRKGFLVRPHVRLWATIDHQGRGYVGWEDERLAEEMTRWIRKYA